MKTLIVALAIWCGGCGLKQELEEIRIRTLYNTADLGYTYAECDKSKGELHEKLKEIFGEKPK